MTSRALLLLAVGAAALAACSPYDPDLGAAPYLCASQAPRCPDDYTCLEDGGRPVCVPSSVAPDGRTGPPACATDGVLEPNDSINQAYQTDVGPGVPMRMYSPLSVCPASDKDFFQINIAVVNKGIRVVTRWDSGAPITCDLLNASAVPIAKGAAMGPGAIRACVTNLPTGIYYAVVFSDQGLQNNYNLELTLVDNCL